MNEPILERRILPLVGFIDFFFNIKLFLVSRLKRMSKNDQNSSKKTKNQKNHREPVAFAQSKAQYEVLFEKIY